MTSEPAVDQTAVAGRVATMAPVATDSSWDAAFPNENDPARTASCPGRVAIVAAGPPAASAGLFAQPV
jgi:hypothetical protein